ncbi:MAG: hypothetical protein ACE5OQ_15875 [Woeseia sp.]
MRLPESIHESLPYGYVIAGALFNAGTIYVGLHAPGAPYYLAVGMLCTLYGLAVFYGREAHRRHAGSNHHFASDN